MLALERQTTQVLENYKNDLVIIDEVQRVTSIFPILRFLVDEHRIPLRFLLLGSASPELIKNSSESLAGRIAYAELKTQKHKCAKGFCSYAFYRF